LSRENAQVQIFSLCLSSRHTQALAAEVAKGREEWDIAGLISFYEDLALE